MSRKDHGAFKALRVRLDGQARGVPMAFTGFLVLGELRAGRGRLAFEEIQASKVCLVLMALQELMALRASKVKRGLRVSKECRDPQVGA